MSRRDDIDDTLDRLLSRNRDDGEGYARGRRNEDSWKGVDMDLANVIRGVNVNWLAQAFEMNPSTIKRRLRDAPVMHRRKEGFIYDLKVAVGYLIEPVFDVDEYMKTAKIEDLPVRLQKEFWDAKNKRRAYELEAGDLWRTSQIMDVFATAFQAIKHSLALWMAEMERETGLTDEQRHFLKGRIKDMQEELYKNLLNVGSTNDTKSILQEELAEEAALDAAKREIQDEHQRHRNRVSYIAEAV